MDPLNWVYIIVLLVVGIAIGAAIYWFLSQRRSRHLQKHYGPEYGRMVEETGDRRIAESELLKREQRVRQFEIRPLTPEDRNRFADSWRNVQARFVDKPVLAVAEANELIKDVMHIRGYPVEHFEQRAADLSVDHPRVVDNYRAAHDLALRSERGEASTEDLRQAMVHYRALFNELLGLVHEDGQAIKTTANSEVR